MVYRVTGPVKLEDAVGRGIVLHEFGDDFNPTRQSCKIAYPSVSL